MELRELKKILGKQHYKVAGNHSAVKICLWTKRSLTGEGVCYKQQFYGIQSHRCLQMTPALGWCTHKCVFCWRMAEYTLDEQPEVWDDPSKVIDECIEGHRKLLSGFGGIPDRVDKARLEEALNPNQAAISLVGEPMIYPKMNELLKEFHKRKFTTFLVSNGTFPDAIKALDELPTQFYLSLDAPDELTYQRIDNPSIKDGWSKINESLELMKNMKCKTALRLTLVKDWNIKDSDNYAALIRKADPDYVEVKAFMLVGGSRRRMTMHNMPSHMEVKEFATELADKLGYKVKDEKEDSRVVLLVNK